MNKMDLTDFIKMKQEQRKAYQSRAMVYEELMPPDEMEMFAQCVRETMIKAIKVIPCSCRQPSVSWARLGGHKHQLKQEAYICDMHKQLEALGE